jgi:arylsulfatase A-like enzyme/tetratricopeptide (TPR) repeat protein
VLLESLLAAALVPQDIILVTIDTLRADHVGAYGSTSGATPSLDAFARLGIVVEDAVVQVPQTRPSHASILTGLLPFQHGIRDNASPPLPHKIPTLAAALRKADYSTAAFIAAYPVSRASGLDSGFDVFDDPFGGGADFLAGEGERNERPAHEVVTAALSWMEKPSTGPRFVWLHFFEPHYPYEPAPPFADRFSRSPYDGEVATADAQLKRFLDRYPPSASRLVVVTSDHGEGLGDHREDEHHLFTYDTTLRVPLLIAGGDLRPGLRVKGQFRSIDLMPTLLDLVGVPAPPVTGVSRGSNLRTGTAIPDNESYAESLYGSLHFAYAPVRALRSEGFKYIDTPRPELYRVVSDPGETANLVTQRAPLAAAMQARLRRIHGEDARRPVVAAPLDPAAQERLAALGYVAGPSVAPAPGHGGLPDPKDRVAHYKRYSSAINAALSARRRHDPAGVVKVLLPLATEFGSSVSVLSFLGEALLELRRFNEAIPYLAKARDASPSAGPSWGRLAEALAGANRPSEALAAVEKGLALSPSATTLIRLRAALLTRAGRAAEAVKFLESKTASNPGDGLLLAEVASFRRNAGDLGGAEALSARAIVLAPEKSDVWLSRGLALGALGRTDEAVAAFERAAQLDPSSADAWFYAAAVQIQKGNGERATELLDKARRIDPTRAGLREATAAASGLRGTRTVPTGPPEKGMVWLVMARCGTREEAVRVSARFAQDLSPQNLSRELSSASGGCRVEDLSWIRAADLKAPLNTAAAKLGPRAISPILELQGAFVLLKRYR